MVSFGLLNGASVRVSPFAGTFALAGGEEGPGISAGVAFGRMTDGLGATGGASALFKGNALPEGAGAGLVAEGESLSVVTERVPPSCPSAFFVADRTSIALLELDNVNIFSSLTKKPEMSPITKVIQYKKKVTSLETS